MTDAPASQTKRVLVATGGAGACAAAIIAVCGPLIGQFEGTRLAPYRDPVGIWTECKGHTGPDVAPGHVQSLAACDQIFDADQRRVIVAIGRCITAPVPIQSFAAMTSFGFNAGPGVVCAKFAPLINAGHLPAACAKLSLYVYADHRQLAGLVARRRQERALCESGLPKA